MTSKAQIRQEIESTRRGLQPLWVRDASRKLVERLIALEAWQAAGTVALYKAIAGEIDLEYLFPLCWERNMTVCIPVYNPASGFYDLAEITPATRCTKGHYGIPEPAEPVPVPSDRVDLMVVPGVAFDTAGHRLGRGGGFYDRLLSGFKGVSVAVAFDFQLYPLIPCESHDMPVDFVVTETKTIKV